VAGIKLAHGTVQCCVSVMKSVLFGMHQRREICDQLSDYQFPMNHSASYVLLGWVHTCNVTAYRKTVSWQCGRDS